jgi:hypothetical protein
VPPGTPIRDPYLHFLPPSRRCLSKGVSFLFTHFFIEDRFRLAGVVPIFASLPPDSCGYPPEVRERPSYTANPSRGFRFPLPRFPEAAAQPDAPFDEDSCNPVHDALRKVAESLIARYGTRLYWIALTVEDYYSSVVYLGIVPNLGGGTAPDGSAELKRVRSSPASSRLRSSKGSAATTFAKWHPPAREPKPSQHTGVTTATLTTAPLRGRSRASGR